MRIVLAILGIVIAACGVIVSSKNGRNGQGALEWVLFIVGIAVFVIGLNL